MSKEGAFIANARCLKQFIRQTLYQWSIGANQAVVRAESPRTRLANRGLATFVECYVKEQIRVVSNRDDGDATRLYYYL